MFWGVLQMLPNALKTGKEVSRSSRWRQHSTFTISFPSSSL